ncbi:L,D-transpeptidase family protein [Sphingomonas sp. GCM10030256]|uniref:L,D-transpeptidase family protein n=1 Tax=Sphingomonas sp. GCM10030256 TaxID=3273427 RepID=UPI00361C13A6
MKHVLLAATLLTALVPAAADARKRPAPAPAYVPAARPVPSDPVDAVYFHRNEARIWFRDAATRAAAASVPSLLRRAQIEGFAAGPQLAAQIDAAIQQASSGNPAAIAAADRAVSRAWVTYVQHLKRPTPGMDYAYPMLKPQGARPDQILLTAAAAPSLQQHVVQASNVNAMYAGIRDAAWAEAQARGNAAPDPRVLINLDRARSIPGAGKFAVVDVAAKRLFMFENGRPVDSMRVIVGEPKYFTPMMASYIHYITLNPYWDAPDHLVRKNIADKVLKGGRAYFESSGYEAMADWTANSAVIPFEQVDWKAVSAGKTQLRVRQKPGPKNFMASMKIPFVNDHDIYLHDTPAKEAFARPELAQSNGCIRLEDAKRFARFLTGGSDPTTASREPEQHMQLRQGIPIYVTYLTAQPRDGKLVYVSDVYGWDKAGGARVADAR